MGAGLQIFNDSGFIQIDGDMLNMEMVAKGAVTIGGTNSGQNGNVSTVDISVAGENPVIAIASPGFCCAYLYSRSGSTFTFRIFNGEAGAQNVEYFIFDNSGGSAGNSGFQVFNAAGRLVFDSNKKYMRVLDTFSFDTSDLSKYFDPNRQEARGYPGGKKIAYVMSDYGSRRVWLNQEYEHSATIQTRWDCCRTTTDTITVQQIATKTEVFSSYRPQATQSVESPSRWLVLDVTNY
jgi:hypothetical protein